MAGKTVLVNSIADSVEGTSFVLYDGSDPSDGASPLPGSGSCIDPLGGTNP